MTISEQIIQVMEKLCEKFGIAIDWTAENVVPYITMLCQKLITFEIASSVMWFLFWLIIAIIGTGLRKKFYPIWEKKNKEDSWDESWIFLMILSVLCEIILWIVCVAVASVQIFDIIKCLTFPELHIIEYVNALIAKG